MYDARDPKTLGNRGDILFGAAVLCIVALAFVIGIFAPRLFSSAPTKTDRLAASDVAAEMDGVLASTFEDGPTRTYLAELKALDQKAYRRLEAEVGAAPDRPGAKRVALLSSDVALGRDPAALLAKSDVKHFDAILGHIQSGLRKASASGADMCRGAFFEKIGLQAPSKDRMERMAEDWFVNDALYGWVIESNLLVLAAMKDAKVNPQDYGQVTKEDEAALQGVFLSLMGDPQIVELVMAFQTENPDALRSANLCSAASSSVAAVKTLPQGAKARIWATALSSGGDIGDFGGFEGLGVF